MKPALKASQPFRHVGRSSPRVDAFDKVTGRALYPGDVSRPGMLHMKVLFSGRPHARIINLDTKCAETLPGVVAVLTAKDVPINEYGFVIKDQPVLCDDVVCFEGDQVAVVIAETERIAAQARDLISVAYDALPVLTDPREAMQSDTTLVDSSRDTNVLEHFPIRKGDIEEGFKKADVIVSGEYYLPMQEHAFLQPEAGLAYIDGDQVVVETAGQWAHHDQRQIAHALGLPLERVRVIYREIGGAFGGREDLSVQIILALAAWKIGRPVKIVWSREESIRGHCKRHQMYITSRWGATNDGRLTAAEVQVIADAGAYAYTSTMVYRQTTLTCTGVYDIPNVKVDGYAVYTNNIPGGALRGFGSPQGIFAAEMQIEKLAEALNIDPVTIRERNLLHRDSLLSVGTALPEGVNLERMLETCAYAVGWTKVKDSWKRPELKPVHGKSIRQGVGLAIGFKNVGFSFGYQDETTATVELHGENEIEVAVVRYAGAEMGQGTLTALRQIAAEMLHLPLQRVRWINADTSLAPEAGSASASRLTLVGGNAIVGACRKALDAWRQEERPAVATYCYRAPQTTAFNPETGQSRPNFAYSLIAQAVEVEVDTDTGKLHFPRVITVVDVGKAINPTLIEGQVQGGIAQGIGYTVIEDFITKDGLTLTPNLSTYLVPTAKDMPDVAETILLEELEPIGPWGARGLGEAPLIAVAPAITSAIQNATGIWMDSLPITPSRLIERLAQMEDADGKGSID